MIIFVQLPNFPSDISSRNKGTIVLTTYLKLFRSNPTSNFHLETNAHVWAMRQMSKRASTRSNFNWKTKNDQSRGTLGQLIQKPTVPRRFHIYRPF